MNIYIDESGIFRNPANKQNIASCVAALILPSSQRANIVKEFNRLKSKWGISKDEVKGSQLNESQISQVISLLKKYEVVLDMVIMDLGLLSESEITDFKKRGADNITATLTPEHHPNVIKQANELRDSFLKMPNQLFVQAFMLIYLIPRLVQNVTIYYSLRIPKELGKFHWVIDAKDKKLTEFEKAWSTVIYPAIYAESIKQPLLMVEGGDYSYFERFYESVDREREIAQEHPEFAANEIGSLATRKLLGESFKFEDSKKNAGLQIVDILANTMQRALNGKLDKSGWGEIGSLTINLQPIRIISFNTSSNRAKTITIKSPFYTVIQAIKQKAKSI